MDEQKRPRAREKRVVNEAKTVEKKGEGLGTGPVNNTGNYEDRRQQQNASSARPAGQAQRPQQTPQSFNPFGQTQQRPQQTQQGFNPFGQTQHRPQQTQQRPQQTQDPFAQRPASTGAQKQYHSGVKQNGSGTQRATSSGGGGKFLLIIIALAVLLGGGKLSGLFGGGGDSALTSLTGQTTTSTTSTQQSSGGLDVGNLLSTFLGSSGTSSYDLSSILGGSGSPSVSTGSISSLFSGSDSTPQYFTASSDDNSTSLDESVAKGAREKYTVIKGNSKDTVTILVYMCGTDLESQQGMATSDLKEMANATIGKNVNLIVYTGGCKRWRNNVISSSVNQVYRISDGKFECVVENAGNASMVNPETLASFIQFGNENYPANRMFLILWDHGGGSISGYGYDEKVGRNQSMSLAAINTALKKGGVKFDFIGFDACLMATVENGLMLDKYADYMIASEETEPGVGWYYTNWLTQLSKNTSMPTIQIGKLIADDFVAVCERQCRGQATTLSVVDLAELSATVPDKIKDFGAGTNELIQNKEYKQVANARTRTREFAQQSQIDQIDLVHFAKNMNTSEGKALAKALQSAVKYNKTGGSISNAYGLSIYFPYKQTRKVTQMVSTYQAIGMDEEYTRCIQEFASLQVSGQVSGGTQLSSYGYSQSAPNGLLGSLLGQESSTSSYSYGGLEELLGGMYGGSSGGSTGSILDLFMGRTMTASKAAEYIMENHFDDSLLSWKNGKITLPKEQWDLIVTVRKNIFLDDGAGFIDLGCDNDFELSNNTLIDNFDGTWLAINRQPVAYYYMDTVEEGDNYVITGYVPALLNGERVKLILQFDSERPYGYIAGAQTAYTGDGSDTQAKTMIAVGAGDTLQFICDYYDYDENYRDTYRLGDPITLMKEVEISNIPLANDLSKCRITYSLTDIYNQNHWTPALQ